jgi:hypothetical protein
MDPKSEYIVIAFASISAFRLSQLLQDLNPNREALFPPITHEWCFRSASLNAEVSTPLPGAYCYEKSQLSMGNTTVEWTNFQGDGVRVWDSARCAAELCEFRCQISDPTPYSLHCTP